MRGFVKKSTVTSGQESEDSTEEWYRNATKSVVLSATEEGDDLYIEATSRVMRNESFRCQPEMTEKKGFGLCHGNSALTEMVLVIMIFTNLMLAFCSPVILAIERVRAEKVIKEYWAMKRVKEENRRAGECKVEVAPLPLPNV
jgi:hypothetical protein